MTPVVKTYYNKQMHVHPIQILLQTLSKFGQID